MPTDMLGGGQDARFDTPAGFLDEWDSSDAFSSRSGRTAVLNGARIPSIVSSPKIIGMLPSRVRDERSND